MSPQARTILNRNGTALVLVVISIATMLVMASFSINVAYMQLVKTELRASADAAAKAGAEALAREDSTTAAKQAATRIAARNRVAGQPLSLSHHDIEIGAVTQGKNGEWIFKKGESPSSSVRITTEKTIPLLMAGISTVQNFAPDVVSTASFSENEICLVIDRSHSMCFDSTGVDFSYPPSIPTGPSDPVIYPPADVGSRWASLETAMQAFLDTVSVTNGSQRIGLVTWGSEITLAMYEGNLTGRTFPASIVDQPLGSSHLNIMNSITARGNDIMLGGTDLSAGIDMGVTVLTGPGSKKSAKKTMIVMTDGKWNFGRDPVKAAKDAKKNNITVHTVTFLDKADQTDMENVATTTGGQHYHASSTAELIEAFEEMARNLPVVLTD